MTPEMIASLRGKYREIKRLRDAHAAEREVGPVQTVAHDPKPEMAALARAFPGALRELDQLPMAEIEERLAVLDEAVQIGAVPQWAALQLAYHGTFRAALRLKRTGGKQLDPAALQDAVSELCRSGDPATAQDGRLLADLEPDALAEILRPAGGRLHPWVLAQVARIFGVSSEAVSGALFLRERVLTKIPEKNRPPSSPKS